MNPAAMVSFDARPGTRRRVGIALLTAVFCSGFQFFHSFGKAFETQPLAPYLLLEVTLSVLVVIAATSIFLQAASGRIRSLDLLFFLFPLCWLALSAMLALIAFHQPAIYALSEDRRILTFLYWFAYDPIRRRFGLTVTDIMLALLMCAGLYLLVAIGLQLSVPGRLSARALPDLDPRRLRMSAPADCFAITFLVGLVGWLVAKRNAVNGAAVIVGLAGLLQVAQTRQVTLAAFATALIVVWFYRPGWVLKVATVGSAALIAMIWLRGPILFQQLIERLLPNINEFFGSNLAENTRMNTLHIVLQLLAENHLLGLGAVSLLYDGGLARLYGRNFFVNDVGVLGEIFRLGLFYAGFVCVYVVWALRCWQRVKCARDRAVISAVYLFYLVLAPTDGFFYRLGFVHAFLFLLMVAAGSQDVAEATDAAKRPAQPGPLLKYV